VSRDRLADVLADALVKEAPLGGVVGVVDMLESISNSNDRIAKAIRSRHDVAAFVSDDEEHVVEDLVQATTYVGSGLHRIADAIERFVDASNRSES
jgi:DNA-binding ferritin-like protein